MGYDHYEISNFSRGANNRSRHSSTYWQGNKEYLAYGMGATSLTANQRITRPRTVSKYYQYVQYLNSGSVPLEFLEV
jgi:oxygen-independent coproporphyrinogen-3 oxidase